MEDSTPWFDHGQITITLGLFSANRRANILPSKELWSDILVTSYQATKDAEVFIDSELLQSIH